MITTVIVDDHPVVRAGIRTVLDAAPDVTVVAEGGSGADALHLVSQHRPDVLVLDVNLPDPSAGSGQALNGVEVTRRLRAQDTTTAILILTAYDDSQTVFGLLEAGATGYVLKDEALGTLVDAVRAAAQGNRRADLLYFPTNLHFTPAGHRVLAERIAEQVFRRVLNRIP